MPSRTRFKLQRPFNKKFQSCVLWSGGGKGAKKKGGKGGKGGKGKEKADPDAMDDDLDEYMGRDVAAAKAVRSIIS